MKILPLLLLILLAPTVAISVPIEGKIKQQRFSDPYLISFSDGPRLSEADFTKMKDELPVESVGAYYRVGFLVYEIYLSLSIELISYGEEGSGKEVIASYSLSGSKISDVIGTGLRRNLKVIRWISPQILLLQIPSIPKRGEIVQFTVDIRGNGEFEIKKQNGESEIKKQK
ncbi:MAG: hypothetical protein CML07_01205 [Psychrobacter sp.]|nr:hypothetical protein [Psychrobacter sp.]